MAVGISVLLTGCGPDPGTSEQLQGHEGEVTSLLFTPDGKYVISGGADGTIRSWHVGRKTSGYVLRGHEGEVLALATTSEGGKIISGGADKTVRVWDAASGKETFTLPGHRGEVTVLAVGSGDQVVASSGLDGDVRIWSLPTGDLLHLVERDKSAEVTSESGTLHGLSGEICSMTFAEEQGNTVLLTGTIGGTITTISVSTGHVLRRYKGDSDRRNIQIGHRGQYQVSAVARMIHVWEGEPAKRKVSMLGDSKVLTNVKFGLDGQHLITTGPDGIKVWSVSPLEQLHHINTDGPGVMALAMSADNSLIAYSTYQSTAISIVPLPDE